MSGFEMTNRFAIFFMAIVVLLIAGPQVSWAQIEEVVVTTRKREESLQELPIAVKAITAEQIQRLGISNLEQAVKFDPSVSFQEGYNPADTKVVIRGLSPTRGRGNVAFLVDGIDISSENMVAAGAGLLTNRRLLNDVVQIEIVKGSQSALYGRSAFTGAISYTTVEPGDAVESSIRLDTAENGYFDISGAIGGPVPGLEEVLGLRLNAVYWSDDGFYDNSVSGNGVGGGDGYGTALVGVWTPGDAWKIKTRVEYSDDHYDPPATVRAPHFAPAVYPEDAIVESVGLAGGYSSTTAGMPDHGLYCAELINSVVENGVDSLPLSATQKANLQAVLNGGDPRQVDTRQRALKIIFPDYPTMTAHAPDPLNPHPDDGVLWKRALSDGSDPMRPGFCLPSTLGSGSDKLVEQGEDWQTGEDYRGTDLEILRASVLIEFDTDFGSFTSNTGYTNANGSLSLDQDYQNLGRPDTFLQNQGSDTDKDTEQFSQEIRFASSWDDSPVQLTLGGLFWHEERQMNDRNYILDCFTTGKTSAGLVLDIPGLCDGGDFSGNVSGPGTTVDSWQAYRAQLEPHPGARWDAETDHWSVYGMLEFELAEHWKLTLEDRWVLDETFHLSKSSFSSCTSLAFGIAGGILALPGAWLDESENPGFDALCTSDGFVGEPMFFEELPADIQAHYMAPNVPCVKYSNVLLPGFPLKTNGIDRLEPLGTPGDNAPLSVDTIGCPYGNIIGTVKSDWHAPKITVDWFPTDDAMLYFSWARSIKPAGISQNASGGAVTTIEDEMFDAEIMEYWELGTKTSWQAAGHLIFNSAVFFLDYTDKQVGTQVLVPDGLGGFRSNSRVINASSAEVWGLEVDASWQPDFFDGLVLSASYTRLYAEYTDFVDETTTFVRSAIAGNCPVVWKDSSNETVATGTANPNPDPTNPVFAPKCALDLTGNQLEFSPEDAFVGQINLTRPLFNNGVDWFVGLDAIYQDERFVDQDNFTRMEDYWLFDLRAGLLGDNWDFLFYINNLFDDDTIRAGSSGPDFGPAISDMGFSAGLVRTQFFGPMPPPRVLGVRLIVRFGNDT